MKKPSLHIFRGLLPLFLTLCIVMAGFLLLVVRQNNFHIQERKGDLQVQNITAKKDLGKLIVSDLRKIANNTYMILLSTDLVQQKVLLHDIDQTVTEVHTALDLLANGGFLSLTTAPPLTGTDDQGLFIAYSPDNSRTDSGDVQTLQSELADLEKRFKRAIDLAVVRNQLLKNPDNKESLQKIGMNLLGYAKKIHSQLVTMTDNANKVVHDANRKLLELREKIIAERKADQRVNILWVVIIISAVFVFIWLIYRQILLSKNKLEDTILKLRQTEQELQQSYTDTVALNRSLEEQVAIRTKELEVSEKLWVDAFDSVALPIFLHNQKGRIIKANRAYLELAGCSFDVAFGQFYWNVFPKREGALPGCLESASKDDSQHLLEQDITVDDRIYRSQSFPIYDDEGKYLYSLHYMEDATEKRKIRWALQESEKRFREVTNSLTDVLILIDKDLKVQLLNDAAKKAYGVTDKNYIGKHCYEVFWDSSQTCDVCPTLEVMRSGKTISAKRYFENGTILNRINSPVHDQAGNLIGCAVIASDVTEQEKQIKKLKRFEQIISTSRDLVAFYDQNHTLLASNPVYADYFGVDPDTIVGRHALDILGDDRYQFYLKFQEKIFKDKESLNFKLWTEYPSAGRRHMEISLTPYIDEDGTVSGVVSHSRDITHKTEQEAKLRLSAKVFESTIEGITITDKDGMILAVNKAFCSITGYSEAEVLGKNPRVLKSGRHGEEFYERMWKSLAERGTWRGEIWNKNKAGRIYPELLTISSILDDEGNTLNYVAVFSDITSIRKVTEQLEYQAHHHPLTGLPNRLMLHIRLEHSIQHAKRESERGAVLFLDLDNFKKINDSLGHGAGDEVLKEVALRLQEHSREVDTVSHLSGDEFVVILQRINSINDALTRAQQILDSLQKPFIIGEYELYISGSIGVTEFSGESDSIEGLLKNADTAMYKAKEGGKNCYHLYSPELTDAAIEKVLLETHLRRALERDELVLYYQPQVTLPTGNVVAVEALIRWQHPDLGLIPPDKFISLSEETGLIIPMGEWILRTACQQLLAWRKQGYGLRRIAVNLSGKQIQQKNLLEMVERILLETGCPSGSLELEITEGFIMQHPEQSISVLQQIRALGVELSVDDFGTGHSSLNYLKRLPINRLKIDRSFVWDINENPDGKAIIKAVIAMGHGLGLQITAEGIETPEQRKFLEDLGCNEVQGYLFSRPLPAEEVSSYLKEHYRP